MNRQQQIKSLSHQYLVAKCDHKPRKPIWTCLRDKVTRQLIAEIKARKRLQRRSS